MAEVNYTLKASLRVGMDMSETTFKGVPASAIGLTWLPNS